MNGRQLQLKLLSMQENMMNFALMLTANRENAQDLLQETTLKVLNSRKKFIDIVNFKAWVLTIMRNLFIKNYNKIVRNHTVIDSDTDLYNMNITNESDNDFPDECYQFKDITKVMNELSDDLKKPFSLYVSGYTYHEIAKILNIPLGTVKSRIFFARQELQNRLKGLH